MKHRFSKIFTPIIGITYISLLTGCPFELNNSDAGSQTQTETSSQNTVHHNSTTTQTVKDIPEDVNLSEIDVLIPETNQTNKPEISSTLTEADETDKSKATTPSNQQTDTKIDISTQSNNSKNKGVTTLNKNTINNEWLAAHNQLRALHQVDNLVWSNALAKQAQNYADTCPEGHSKQGKAKYGENLAFSTAPVMSYTDVVKAWYDEINLYDFNQPKFSAQVGHFTQVVWKTTTQVGCGYKSGCKTGDWSDIWVCQYQTPGNILGQFAKNVLPATKARDKSNDNPIKFDNEQPTQPNTKYVDSNQNTSDLKPKQPNKPLDEKYAQIQIEVKEGKKVLQGDGVTITQNSVK